MLNYNQNRKCPKSPPSWKTTVLIKLAGHLCCKPSPEVQSGSARLAGQGCGRCHKEGRVCPLPALSPDVFLGHVFSGFRSEPGAPALCPISDLLWQHCFPVAFQVANRIESFWKYLVYTVVWTSSAPVFKLEWKEERGKRSHTLFVIRLETQANETAQWVKHLLPSLTSWVQIPALSDGRRQQIAQACTHT